MAAEFNSDDRPDLAITDRGTSDITVLFGRGDGTFEDQGQTPWGMIPWARSRLILLAMDTKISSL